MLDILVHIIATQKLKTVETIHLETELIQKMGISYGKQGGYLAFSQCIQELCEDKLLEAIKASKSNGRNPALFNRYRKQREVLSKEEQAEFLFYHYKIKTTRFLNHPDTYRKYKQYVQILSEFLYRPDIEAIFSVPNTAKERSFQIFKEEKFLEDKNGREFLTITGLTLNDLNCYVTYEPFFYSDFTKIEPQGKILIIENKDTFDSLDRCFTAAYPKIFNMPIRLLIYGEGWKITRSLGFLSRIIDGPCQVYYFGDIDATGIEIFGELQKTYPNIPIEPYVQLYEQLLDKYYKDAPPIRDKKQQKKYVSEFLHYFPEQSAKRIKTLLVENKYIPQEGLSFGYFREVIRTDV
ncbi:MAG: DUF2399 domain-containing protein [Clostridiales bacterium]|nr:DUF2399 domain-containing protein [Clostridiales bacterium]